MSQTLLKPNRSNKNIERFIRSVFYNPKLPLLNEFIDYFYKTMETSHNLLFISRLSSSYGRKKLSLLNSLVKIKNNTLIIWGEKDKLMPLSKVEQNFKLIPKVEVRIIKDAGHIPSIEKSEEFNKIIVDFLD